MISYKEKIAEILAPHVDGLEKDEILDMLETPADSAGISGRKRISDRTRRHGAKRQHTAESILCRNDAGRWRYIGNSKFCRRWLIYG